MDSPHRGRYTFTWSIRYVSEGSTFPLTQNVTAQQFGISEDLPGFVSFWQWLPGDVKQYVASFPTGGVVAVAPVSPMDDEDTHHAETWATTSGGMEPPF